jgi:hypothetical protein
LTNAFFSWELANDNTADKPIINSLRLNYDDQTWKKQLSQCQPDASDLMVYHPMHGRTSSIIPTPLLYAIPLCQRRTTVGMQSHWRDAAQ